MTAGPPPRTIGIPGHLDVVRSHVDGIAWPPIAAPPTAPLLLLVERLDRSQWFAPETLATAQHRQLVVLADHLTRHSPAFAARMKAAGLTPPDLLTPTGLHALPPTIRRDFQRPEAEVDCAVLPEGHGPTTPHSSSGSTGEPVTVRRTAINHLMWQAQTMRWHLWSGENFRGRLAIVRSHVKRPGTYPNWGVPIEMFYSTGPAMMYDSRNPYDTIAAEVAAFGPTALLIYPNVMNALFDRIDAGQIALPALQTVRLVSETVPDALRERAKGRVRLNSSYSTMEMGYLTLECPVSGLHHIMSETAIVEVVDEDDQPVAEGEIGRVVVTDLHNFATPIVRYANGDWAEAGPACPCGRGLPTLKRIMGRQRNQLTLPDGRTRWARTGAKQYREVTQITQVQLVQHARDRIEVRYTAPAPLTPEEATVVIGLAKDETDPAMAIELTYVEGRLDNPKTGKFEEFVSRIL